MTCSHEDQTFGLTPENAAGIGSRSAAQPPDRVVPLPNFTRQAQQEDSPIGGVFALILDQVFTSMPLRA